MCFTLPVIKPLFLVLITGRTVVCVGIECYTGNFRFSGSTPPPFAKSVYTEDTFGNLMLCHLGNNTIKALCLFVSLSLMKVCV